MRLYDWLLRLFPSEFRARFGADMAEAFADHRRAAKAHGRLAGIRLWARAAADVCGAAWRERRRDRTPFDWRPHMLGSDIAHALRLIARQRGFSLAVMLTIALGVGATTSVFTVANALIFRALPYAHADRLVRVFEQEDQRGFSGNLALGNLDDWCGVPGIEACGAYTTSDLNLAGGDAPERVRGAIATPGLFAALDLAPASGRLIDAADIAAKAPVVMISQSAARRLFAAREPVGETLLLDSVRYDVVGVLPDVPALSDVAVWRAVGTSGQTRRNHANRGIARLREGVSIDVVRQQLDSVSRALQSQFPDTNAHWWGRVEPLQASMSEDLTVLLRALGALTGVLLLLCAVSAASLLAGRSAGRQRELAVRLALGAGRRRLLTQLFTESAALAIGGAIIGTFLSVWTVGAVVAVFPPRTPLWRTPTVDLRVVAFAMTTALVAAVVFGLLPALGLTRRTSAAASLQLRFTRGAGRLRSALTVLQTGLAAMLLVAATLLGAVLSHALLRDPGFRTDHLLLFSVTPPRGSYADAAALDAVFTQFSDRLRHLPQVEAVGASFNPPMSGSSTIRGIIRVDEPVPQRGQGPLVLFQVSTPGYLGAMGLKLVDGRDFTGDDTATSAPVTIINERLARELWPGQRAVGQQLLVYTDEKTPRTVVGVIADAAQANLDEAVDPEHYVPQTQSPRRTLTFALRLRAPLSHAALQAEVAAVDPALPLYDVTTMDALMGERTSSRIAITRLSSLFAVAALLLAAVGLYGLVSAGVTERTREIGVRLALGAPSGAVMQLALRRGLAMAAAGTTLGLAAAVPVRTLIEGLFGDAPPPSTVTAVWLVGAMLITVAAIACWIPARAAVRVDPAISLRPE